MPGGVTRAGVIVPDTKPILRSVSLLCTSTDVVLSDQLPHTCHPCHHFPSCLLPGQRSVYVSMCGSSSISFVSSSASAVWSIFHPYELASISHICPVTCLELPWLVIGIIPLVCQSCDITVADPPNSSLPALSPFIIGQPVFYHTTVQNPPSGFQNSIVISIST